MRRKVFYNDNDPWVLKWIENLSDKGVLSQGVFSSSPIEEIGSLPCDLVQPQSHFFAGIGGWPQALRLAGWPEDQPVWTGSCPCQGLSLAGKGKAEEDERHLWPEWRRLIALHRPPVIFGEQVDSVLGRRWLSEVRFDLEHLGYWEVLEQNIERFRGADTVDDIATLCADVFTEIESGDFQKKPFPAESKPTQGSWRASNRSFAKKESAEAKGGDIFWHEVLGSQQNLFFPDAKAGTDSVESVREDALQLFSEEDLSCEKKFREKVRLLFALSVNRRCKAGAQSHSYRFVAASLPACAVGAPHLRKRLFWAAWRDAEGIDAKLLPVQSKPFRGNFHKENVRLIPCMDGVWRLTHKDIFPLKKLPSSKELRSRRGRMIGGFGNAIVPELASVFVRAVACAISKDGEAGSGDKKVEESFEEALRKQTKGAKLPFLNYEWRRLDMNYGPPLFALGVGARKGAQAETGAEPLALKVWPTATRQDNSRFYSAESMRRFMKDGHVSKHCMDLNISSKLAIWATSRHNSAPGNPKRRTNPNGRLEDQVFVSENGEWSPGMQLNESFSGWLMGYGRDWSQTAPGK